MTTWQIAKADRLIVIIGNSSYKRCIGNPAKRKYNVSSTMCLVARLLKELRILANNNDRNKDVRPGLFRTSPIFGHGNG